MEKKIIDDLEKILKVLDKAEFNNLKFNDIIELANIGKNYATSLYSLKKLNEDEENKLKIDDKNGMKDMKGTKNVKPN